MEAKRNERKDWALELAGVKNRRGALTKTLPGGYKERLALGCAILHEPSILFLDDTDVRGGPCLAQELLDADLRNDAKGNDGVRYDPLHG